MKSNRIHSHPFFPLALVTLVLSGPHIEAADFHISATGKDSNPGSAEAPFATLSAARYAARKKAGKESVTIHVADGIHYLLETLVFRPEDSGTKDHPVLWRAVNKGRAVLSGGRKLKLDWKP